MCQFVVAFSFFAAYSTADCVAPYAAAVPCSALLRYRIARSSLRRAFTRKSNTRNRITGTNCTQIAVSCTGFRGVWTVRYKHSAFWYGLCEV
eukprot:2763685-Rhodomonas_salina.1